MCAYAQQASSAPPSQEELNRQLLQRIEELETQVKQLQGKQAEPVVTAAPVRTRTFAGARARDANGE